VSHDAVHDRLRTGAHLRQGDVGFCWHLINAQNSQIRHVQTVLYSQSSLWTNENYVVGKTMVSINNCCAYS
jgi:hypothetical protein